MLATFSHSRLVPLWRVLVVLLVCVQGGCISLSQLLSPGKKNPYDTTLLKMQGYSLPPGGGPTAVPPSTISGPRVVMEVRDGKERHMETIPLPSDRSMTVEDLVQEAELHKKLGKVSIAIVRPVGPENPPVRLDVPFDSKGRVKNVGQNYALLPSDHLIVVSDNRSGLEKFIDNQLGK